MQKKAEVRMARLAFKSFSGQYFAHHSWHELEFLGCGGIGRSGLPRSGDKIREILVSGIKKWLFMK